MLSNSRFKNIICECLKWGIFNTIDYYKTTFFQFLPDGAFYHLLKDKLCKENHLYFLDSIIRCFPLYFSSTLSGKGFSRKVTEVYVTKVYSLPKQKLNAHFMSFNKHTKNGLQRGGG